MSKLRIVSALLLLVAIPALADDRHRRRSDDGREHGSRGDWRERSERNGHHAGNDRSDSREREKRTDQSPIGDRTDPAITVPPTAAAPVTDIAPALALDTRAAAKPEPVPLEADMTAAAAPGPMAATSLAAPASSLPTGSSSAASAASDACSTAPVARWLSPPSIADRLSAKGFSVTRIDAGNGCYVAQVKDRRGLAAELGIDAVTAEILTHKERQ